MGPAALDTQGNRGAACELRGLGSHRVDGRAEPVLSPTHAGSAFFLEAQFTSSVWPAFATNVVRERGDAPRGVRIPRGAVGVWLPVTGEQGVGGCCSRSRAKGRLPPAPRPQRKHSLFPLAGVPSQSRALAPTPRASPALAGGRTCHPSCTQLSPQLGGGACCPSVSEAPPGTGAAPSRWSIQECRTMTHPGLFPLISFSLGSWQSSTGRLQPALSRAVQHEGASGPDTVPELPLPALPSGKVSVCVHLGLVGGLGQIMQVFECRTRASGVCCCCCGLFVLTLNGFWAPLSSRSFFTGPLRPKGLLVESGCRDVPSIWKTMNELLE